MWNKIKLHIKTIGIVIALIGCGIIGFLFNRKFDNEFTEKLKKRKKKLNELIKDCDNFLDDSKSKGL